MNQSKLESDPLDFKITWSNDQIQKSDDSG